MTKTHCSRLLAVSSVALLVQATPAVALAEENTGMKLLLPNMAEFVPACIAFLIIFFIMSKFAWPMVLQMMEERENKIQGDLDAAEQAREKAEADAASYKERIAEAEREADEIVAQAKREAEQEAAKIVHDAHVQATEVIEKGHKAVEGERARAMAELAQSVTELSVEIAGKIIGEGLDVDEQRKLAARYLDEMESADA